VRAGEHEVSQVQKAQPEAGQATAEAVDLYLELLKISLCGLHRETALYPVAPSPHSIKQRVFEPARRLLAARGLVLARSIDLRTTAFDQSPPPRNPLAETLIGPRGLDNIRACVEDVLQDEVAGDLIEAGVWRGGAAVFMRAVMEAQGDASRLVWVADSFRGLPTPEQSRYAEDVGEEWWADDGWLSVPLDEVKRTFARYGFLDDRVRFLVGWFAETLPTAPIQQLALIRIDGDMYGSTMDSLDALYPRLSVGGYLIVDDYWLPNCQAAVDEYRRKHGITDRLFRPDRAIAYWRRSG
jgi:O-methyltransferase